MRERDFRNGIKELLDAATGPMLPHRRPVARAPALAVSGFLRDGGLMKFPNVVLPDGGPMRYADVGAALEQSVVTWDDFDWIRDAWGGPIVVKGVHTADDARRAVDAGADGDRRVQPRRPAARRRRRRRCACCPRWSQRSAASIEVLIDGGIRRGSDIVKALCLGARAVLIGRAYAYGLGAGGQVPASRARSRSSGPTSIRTMKLLGCASVAWLGCKYIE